MPPTETKTLIDIANSRTDVLDMAKAQGGDPFTAGTGANTWLNNWWNTAGKNEYPNITLGQPSIASQTSSTSQVTDINAGYEKRQNPGGWWDIFKKGTNEHIDLNMFKSLGLNVEAIPEGGTAPPRDGKSIADYAAGLDNQNIYGNFVDVNGTIYNKATGKGYPTEEAFRKDLGIEVGQPINWSVITKATEAPKPLSVQTSGQARMAKLRAELGIGPPPVAPDSFTEEDKTRLGTARTERDVLDLELATITSDKMALEDEFRKYKVGLTGLPEGGRLGAVSEKEREMNERLFALQRREFIAETKLSNRNTVISELMSSQRQEYADAVQQYQVNFNQALQLYSIMDKDEDEMKTNAKANLDVLMQAYQGKVDSLTPLQLAKLEEYEIQAGLPIGSSVEILRNISPEEEKLYSGVDDNGMFTLITRSADGTINTYKQEGATAPKSYAPSGGGGGDETGDSAVENIVAQGLSASIITNTGKLTEGIKDKLLDAGLPPDVIEYIFDGISNGFSLEDIRQDLSAQLGEPAHGLGYRYLDLFMSTLQGEGEKTIKDPFGE